MNSPAWSDRRNEIQTNSIFLELNGDGGSRACSRGSLYNRVGILATRKEAALFTVFGKHVGLCQNLNQAFAFESLDGSSQIETGEECKEIELIGQAGGRRGCGARETHPGRGELS